MGMTVLEKLNKDFRITEKRLNIITAEWCRIDHLMEARLEKIDKRRELMVQRLHDLGDAMKAQYAKGIYK